MEAKPERYARPPMRWRRTTTGSRRTVPQAGGIEHLHGEQVLQAMGWASPPPHRGDFRWQGTEAPESGERGELHYLMHPYHALRIAHQNEQRAFDFFGHVARSAGNAAVRKAAAEIEEEEREHVHLIEEWLKRTPQPPSDWAFDPDPPTGGT
jgi:hypothetical protein